MSLNGVLRGFQTPAQDIQNRCLLGEYYNRSIRLVHSADKLQQHSIHSATPKAAHSVQRSRRGQVFPPNRLLASFEFGITRAALS